MVVARTERLVLRTFAASDLDDLALIMADPEVMSFSADGPWDRARTLGFIEGCLADYSKERWGFGLWAVVRKDDSKLIGYCGLTRFEDIDGASEIEVGYRLARESWNRGFATEAATAVRDYAFNHLGIPRLISMIEPENGASARVAAKIGMALEKEISKWGRRVLVYAVSTSSRP
jgi:RimJ/RimL family protein N-acetyltransferase